MKPGRKGEMSASLLSVILVLIGLVVVFIWIMNIGAKEQKIGTYMNLPGGVSMKVLPEGSGEFKLPPEGMMFIDGTSCRKGLLDSAAGRLGSIIGSGGEPEKCFESPDKVSLIPTVVMYPLITSSGCPSKIENFGSMKLQMDIDISKFESYLRENYKLSFGSDKLAPEENIWIRLCWGKEKCYNDETSGSSLKDLSECAASGGKYSCTFELENIVEKCCPSDIRIDPVIEATLQKTGEDGSVKKVFEATAIAPVIVYYADDPSNEDSLFENFGSLQTSCFFDEERKETPVKDIYIYPCRAAVPGREFDSLEIAGASGEKINLAPCQESPIYARLESGWLCKKTSKTQYYLLNPYAFCRLDGDSLPERPEPIYLESRIPSEPEKILGVANYQAEQAWVIAKNEIDRLYFQ